MQDTPLQQLQSFLNKLFQFESQDLDFGVYKILHYKRNEVKHYIDKLLVDEVKKELSTLTESEAEHIDKQLAELANDGLVGAWINAKDKAQKNALIDSDSQGRIKQYQKLNKQKTSLSVSKETENQIYNHLTTFFSRYYDKGDFVSKRRFGKSEKYMVPYNGEETHFHWANHDQYYIKSSETFQQYSFKLGNYPVRFKLTEAKVEQGNVKADESSFFVLSEATPDINKKEAIIYFEYRPLTAEEKKEYTGNNKQEAINDKAFETLRKSIGKNTETLKLFEAGTDGETPVLLQKLRHYTRKNTYDFFIHKDLKGFLTRELDFYIKSELINVDDLYVSDAAEHFDALEHNFRTIKVFKTIADSIISFTSQIEEFQKKLWEKKKFVLGTEWIITLDRLVEYIGEEEAKPFIESALKNKKQVAEWTEFFGAENVPGKLSVSSAKKDDGYLKLPIDTVHFDESFKEALFNALSEKIDLEEVSDGFVINSDNYHGINAIGEKFRKRIKNIHIDPPYNTATSGFLYKNTFQHSSWLTMMDDRLSVAKKLLSDKASLQIHIDENEYENLDSLLRSYPLFNAGPVVWDKRNPMNGSSGVATQHEYIIWKTTDNQLLQNESDNVQIILNKAKEIIAKHGSVNSSAKKEFSVWISQNQSLSGGEKAYKHIDNEGRVYRHVSMRAPEPRSDEKFHQPLIHPLTGKPCAMPPNGYSRTPETLQEMINRGEIIFGKDETTQPQQKLILASDSKRQFSSLIANGYKGRADTAPMGLEFPYCHPTSLYYDFLLGSGLSKSDVILDFFAGSGTTHHAVQIVNRSKDLGLKTVLVEQGQYVHTVILPRIKKVAYSFDWKEGKPKDESMNGLGVFVKYQRLEQYEEVLENVSFNANGVGQDALKFTDYVPKYMLNFETKDSQTLVNTDAFKDPWDYKLKVWDGYTYDTEKAVDVVETFNYLIGLHVEKFVTKELNKQKYQFVLGHNNDGKKLLVVWRAVKGWKAADYTKDAKVLKDELKGYKYDTLYINDQANIDGYEQTEDVFKHLMMN